MTINEKIKRIESAMWVMQIRQGTTFMVSVTIEMLKLIGKQEEGEDMIDKLMEKFNIT